MTNRIVKTALLALIAMVSVKATAQDINTQATTNNVQAVPPYSILAQNRVSNGKTVWITIYNNFGMIRDSGCVEANGDNSWSGYYPPLSYSIRGEIKSGPHCSGNTEANIYSDIDAVRGSRAVILSYDDHGTTRYMFKTSLGKEQSQVPQQNDDEVSNNNANNLRPHDIGVHNTLSTGQSVWVTIYNVFDSIRDSGCVQPGEERAWGGYHDFGFAYRVRIEVKAGANCSGATVNDQSAAISDISYGQGVRVSDYMDQGKRKYVLVKYY